jgi:hypothetical protein
MRSTRWVRGLSALVIAGAVVGGGRADAQLRFGGTPGYPSVGHYGSVYGGGIGSYQGGYGPGISLSAGSSYNSYGNLGYGGFGTTPYSYGYGGFGTTPYSYGYGGGLGYGVGSFPGYGYGVSSGTLGTGYQAATPFLRGSNPASTAPQTRTALQPVYDLITGVPGWRGSSRPPRPSSRVQPRVPREQLLGDDGTILWPAATPDDPGVAAARRAAEGAVKEVVREGKTSGHATVRQVVDAKAKLNAFARETLPKVKARNAVDASGLETFLVELEKTLQTMADRY